MSTKSIGPDGTLTTTQWENTDVDLGLDLLNESTVATTVVEKVRAEKNQPSADPHQSDDLYKSAEILLNEGFDDDAKKLLWKILRNDSNYLPARKKLEEIHETELRQILGQSDDSVPKGFVTSFSPHEAESVLSALDHDLNLGMPSFFADTSDQLVDQLRPQWKDLSPKDQIDLGVAFAEMGFYPVAVEIFQDAAQSGLNSSAPDLRGINAAWSLMAFALIQNQEPLEAVMVIEPVLADADTLPEEKVEFLYLMGRAYEKMDRADVAIQWFQQVVQLDSSYRDAADRLQGNLKRIRSNR